MTDTEWATREAYNWLAATNAAVYHEAKREAGYGLFRFRTWAEDTLTRTEGWDDEDTADVNYEELMADILSE